MAVSLQLPGIGDRDGALLSDAHHRRGAVPHLAPSSAHECPARRCVPPRRASARRSARSSLSRGVGRCCGCTTTSNASRWGWSRHHRRRLDRRPGRDRAALHHRRDGGGAADLRPHTPLELAGREIYMREGCYACHSQHDPLPGRRDRPLRPVFARRGIGLRPSDAVGVEAHRAGSRAGRREIFRCLACRASRDPRAVVPASILPAYPWLAATPLDISALPAQDGDAGAARRALFAEGSPTPPPTRWRRPAPTARARRASRNAYGARVAVRPFGGDPRACPRWDAVVAYLQSLGG